MKIITLALCIIAILSAAASAFFYFEIGQTKDELNQKIALTETKNTELQTKQEEADAQAEVLKKRLAALDGDLGESKVKFTASETRNTQLARDIAQQRTQIAAKGEAEQVLNAEISQLKGEIGKAKLEASSSSPEVIEGYKTTIATQQTRITELESAAPRPDVKTKTVARSLTESGTRYEVVSVGAQNAFVVINAGSAQGLEDEQNLSITSNGKSIAEAVISTVQKNFSIAQIVTESLRAAPTKGDTATVIH